MYSKLLHYLPSVMQVDDKCYKYLVKILHKNNKPACIMMRVLSSTFT